MEDLRKEIGVFNNRNRLAILKYLKNKGERPVGSIADSVSLNFKTTSKQLIFLTKKGVLISRYDGNFVLYGLASGLPKLSKSIIALL